jgi:hypothetical protein
VGTDGQPGEINSRILALGLFLADLDPTHPLFRFPIEGEILPEGQCEQPHHHDGQNVNGVHFYFGVRKCCAMKFSAAGQQGFCSRLRTQRGDISNVT